MTADIGIRVEPIDADTRFPRLGRLGLCFAVLLAGCTPSPAPPRESGRWRSMPLSVPVIADGEARVSLVGKVCRPDTDRPAPAMVYAHGAPPASERPTLMLKSCDDRSISWFLERGFVVVQALRRGYGDTGGENADSIGQCRDPDYVHSGLEGAIDVDATIRAASHLPFVDPAKLVLVGQSAGGWAALAYSSAAHPDAAAIVLMAPGNGGHVDGQANWNCDPGRLVSAAGVFGRTSRGGVLWVTAENDTRFGPDLVVAMQNAFRASGGVVSAIALGPFGNEGHALFNGHRGTAVWGPILTAYLEAHGIPVATSAGKPDRRPVQAAILPR